MEIYNLWGSLNQVAKTSDIKNNRYLSIYQTKYDQRSNYCFEVNAISYHISEHTPKLLIATNIYVALELIMFLAVAQLAL